MKLFTCLQKVCVRHAKVYAKIENPYPGANYEIKSILLVNMYVQVLVYGKLRLHSIQAFYPFPCLYVSVFSAFTQTKPIEEKNRPDYNIG
jgi:hypothetical protein